MMNSEKLPDSKNIKHKNANQTPSKTEPIDNTVKFKDLISGELFENYTWDGTTPDVGMFAYKQAFQNANLPNVKYISHSLFRMCSCLMTVNAPKAKGIGNCSFKDCFLLSKVIAPEVRVICAEAFESCVSLTEVSFFKVKQIHAKAFSKCTSISTVNLPQTTFIGKKGFRGCEHLSTIELPSAISLEKEAITKCPGLKKIDLPNARNCKAACFSENPALKTVNLPKVVFEEKDIHMFEQCVSLQTVNLSSTEFIPDFTFYNCHSLKTIILSSPKLVTRLSKDKSEFIGCCHFLGESVESDGVTYNPECKKDGFIYVPDNLVEEYKNNEDWKFLASQFKGLSELPQDENNETDSK